MVADFDLHEGTILKPRKNNKHNEDEQDQDADTQDETIDDGNVVNLKCCHTCIQKNEMKFICCSKCSKEHTRCQNSSVHHPVDLDVLYPEVLKIIKQVKYQCKFCAEYAKKQKSREKDKMESSLLHAN